ncbi:hypothetical protein [Paenibacillus odorifer]|uniref:Uncharacterized protein n=1 Tax=Paenibacillus odorifer TaxID=189426 RepID=A0A1R0WSC8_9BACL|nr:hypothetical protein [Paenibacillus odorifer]OMD20336.1 hypothetical protein BJP51_09640 [Paenibacillus odorifer]OMD70875.1 hypothetical protein BSK48_14055 [Paenibacillus odorifer]
MGKHSQMDELLGQTWRKENWIEDGIKIWSDQIENYSSEIDVEDANDYHDWLSIIDPFDWNSLNTKSKTSIVYLDYQINRYYMSNPPFTNTIGAPPELLINAGVKAVDNDSEEYSTVFDIGSILFDFIPQHKKYGYIIRYNQ